MGYKIKVTYPDGRVNIRKQVYKTKSGATRKAKWIETHLKPEVEVIHSRS